MCSRKTTWSSLRRSQKAIANQTMYEESQFENKRSQGDQGGTVSPVPAEIDSRIYMAAERTFLAWIRTGIALMGFGFVVARFGLFLRGTYLGKYTPAHGKYRFFAANWDWAHRLWDSRQLRISHSPSSVHCRYRPQRLQICVWIDFCNLGCTSSCTVWTGDDHLSRETDGLAVQKPSRFRFPTTEISRAIHYQLRSSQLWSS